VFAQALKTPQLSNKRFVIEGHTDSIGGRHYNLDLSRRRAQAVVEYLTSLGVDSSRLDVRGYGFDRPLDGRSAAAMENRRVEAVLATG
jgi:outer membrane protein OmpA-like peptidoglycan-associated protein